VTAVPDYLPLPGTPVEELETPCAIVDLDLMELNIETAASFYRDRPAKIRPHIKGHKCPAIARRIIKAGSALGGVAAAKVGEAEAMVEGGIRDELIYNIITTPPKVRRLCSLAKNAKITVTVDDPGNVEELSEAAQAFGVTLDICVEVDVGGSRTGRPPGQPGVDLCRMVAKTPGLRYAGIVGYEGAFNVEDFETRTTKCLERTQRLLDTREMLEKAGLYPEIVGCGGTSTWNIGGAQSGITETQPGRYVVGDLIYRGLGFATALKVLSTVISRPRENFAVIDCGHKAIGLNYYSTIAELPYKPFGNFKQGAYDGFPEVEYPDGAKVLSLDAEHGRLHLEGEANKLKCGDKVTLLPAYEASTANQHTHYYGVQNGKVKTVWEISARDKFR
jgi:3-hydroxy-D-aspartate aldolase